ncbi:uncharacterized protein H6S33_005278 [Morchella sextelata]|uniref:uncharacterized protein n=1 Tax=Morchella sextelata TaxID=1174677 RepID=UPI001D04FDF0|nr:uncharacterized protein H6S33_005278 [Morchella sextelata]KAH0605296.1 hypothetical protein H6S33_005278 [Morchella sextelata]
MLQRTYNAALQGQRSSWPESLERDPCMIHERHLVKKLLEAAAGRRCKKTSETWSRAEMQRAVDDGQLKDMALDAVGFLKETLTGLFHEREGGHTIPSNAANQGHPGSAVQAKPPASHRPHTQATTNLTCPGGPTTSDALHAELLRRKLGADGAEEEAGGGRGWENATGINEE